MSIPAEASTRKRFFCETCGVGTTRRTDLNRHMLTHNPEKEEYMYSCPYDGCNHKTLQKSNLETHIRVHMDLRSSRCTYFYPDGERCTFAAVDPSSLCRHKKQHPDE